MECLAAKEAVTHQGLAGLLILQRLLPLHNGRTADISIK
jgi:hypothetical protein